MPPVRTGPRFLTREADVKPPYPPSKLREGEEAVLKLKLSIDERGRVISVEPVGAADPVFLAAARKHVMARWRYQPATEDGRPVATTTTITLHFELDG
jgi:protein TonB